MKKGVRGVPQGQGKSLGSKVVKRGGTSGVYKGAKGDIRGVQGVKGNVRGVSGGQHGG